MYLGAEQIKVRESEAEYSFGARAGVSQLGPLEKYHSGFTLVELITIMIIIGILAAVAVPRFFDNNVFQARGTADQVAAALRFGQKVAIAQHRNVNVTISSATDSNCGAVLTGGNIHCVVSNSVLAAGFTKTVTFNALGQPVPNSAVPIVVGTITINIEAETGYVH